eukprot:763056-Hanusia_phi.AAC.5
MARKLRQVKTARKSGHVKVGANLTGSTLPSTCVMISRLLSSKHLTNCTIIETCAYSLSAVRSQQG